MVSKAASENESIIYGYEGDSFGFSVKRIETGAAATAIKVEDIALDFSDYSSFKKRLKLTKIPNNAIDKLYYTTDDESIATVTDEGIVEGLSEGETNCRVYTINPNVNIEGVEIDQKIADLSYKYFELPEDIKITTYDGRAFLQEIPDDRLYDVIVVDAYQDITIPFQMATVEFFTLVKQHLCDDGVMVVNMNMRDDSEGNINEYLSDTISSVFPEVYTADVYGCTNRELFAGNIDLIEAFHNNTDLEENDVLINAMAKVDRSLVKYEAGNNIMTDDKAPVELLSMKAIDGLISNETSYYKDLYDNEGIEGLLNELS